MNRIDLRSDTVTLPTDEMREAVRDAELGDDVFGEDPTVNRLEETACERVGKEAGLLVPTGTMGNLVCVLTHCARGEEAILGDQAHIFLNEAGGMSALGGIHARTVPNEADGTMRLEDIEGAIRGVDVHFPRSRLICLENTHNRCSGSPLTGEYTDRVAALAKRRGLRVHLDGARVFNAAVALGIDIRELTRGADSLSFCMSKGLSAPVGSVVCGSREFIAECRRTRKVLGGGMRQAGIVAAAGQVSLEGMVERLEEDHENARKLAEGLPAIAGLSVTPCWRRTNIVYVELESEQVTDEQFAARLAGKGVILLRTAPRRFRMVTHYGISGKDIEAALAAMEEVMQGR